MLIEVELSLGELYMNCDPFFRGHFAIEEVGYLCELTGVFTGQPVPRDALFFKYTLARRKYLAGIYGFGEIFLNIRTYGLFHHIFFFAFGDHDHRE